jgi:Right handed beta helix region
VVVVTRAYTPAALPTTRLGEIMRRCHRTLLAPALAMLLAGLPLVAPAQAAALVVVTGGDAGAGTCTPAACTLRDAIAAAAPGDKITFANSVPSPITLTAGELAIDKNLTITGPTGRVLAIDGNASSRVLHVGAVTVSTLTMSYLTIQNGKTPNDIDGGGILVEIGSGLTLSQATVRGNQAARNWIGGGIFTSNNATTILTNVTLSGNSGVGAGAAILSGQATLTNVTINGNTSTVAPNPVLQNGGGSLMHLVNATVVGNTGTGIALEGGDAKNTIVANNSSGNCGGPLSSSLGNNLEFPGDTCGFNQGSDVHVDPLLGALRLNAPGLLETMALLPGSPAIDAGTGSGCPANDERGVKRPKLLACDIGAYEFMPRVTAQGAVAIPGGTAQFRVEPVAPPGGGTPTNLFTWTAPGATIRSNATGSTLAFSGDAITSTATVGGTCINATTRQNCTYLVTLSVPTNGSTPSVTLSLNGGAPQGGTITSGSVVLGEARSGD